MSLLLSGVNTYRPRQPADFQLQTIEDAQYSPRAVLRADIEPWPRSGLLGIDYANFYPVWNSVEDLWSAQLRGGAGNHASYWIHGQTLDSTGAAKASCTVDLFDVATDVFVCTVTSDSNGNYVAGTPYNATVYAVAHEESTPTMGRTDNVSPGTAW